jgi:antagonist of KipI
MKLEVLNGGMLTTVQDTGRWGHQSDGVPVAGAMDLTALKMGNAMLGNGENCAALEITILGPRMRVLSGGHAVLAGGDLSMTVGGVPEKPWKVIELKKGDIISFGVPKYGCRACLCIAGGVDVPLVMGSRSTYTRAKIGGHEGRSIRAGDILQSAEGAASPQITGFTLPEGLIPDYGADEPLKVVEGLQREAFTDKGAETFFSSEYKILNDSDRMGFRFEGPEVEHKAGADIVSDAIPLGAVQIPGSGMPIAMLADRQTTGGYTKIGVLTPESICRLVQMMPGALVSFERAEEDEAIAELRAIKRRVERIKELRMKEAAGKIKSFRIRVAGKSYDVTCEEID